MSNPNLPTLPSPLARAEAGAAFLDVHEPDWFVLIDGNRLDINAGNACILGQLSRAAERLGCERHLWYLATAERYGLDAEAMVRYGLMPSAHGGGLSDARDDGFLLTVAWVAVIAHRRAAAPTTDEAVPEESPAEAAAGLARLRELAGVA